MINRNALRTLLFLVVVLLIVLNYAGPAIGISTALQLEKQGSPAVWFKSFLFLACAVILSLIALQVRHTGQGNGWRWGVFAGVMLYLSINSATRINKKLVLNFIDWAWWFEASFIELVIFLLLAGALLWILWPVFTAIPARYFQWILLSGVIFGSGAILFDDLNEWGFHDSSQLLLILEEVFEFAGIILFLDTLLAYLSAEFGPITLSFQRGDRDNSQTGS